MKSTIDASFSRDSINYSMVWEDPKLLFESIPKKENLNVLSIGSAGCNCLSLLLKANAKVTAVDLSAPQTYLIELKKEAIKKLSYYEYLSFFDYVENHCDKASIYKSLRLNLNKNAKNYWDNNQKTISSGIIHNGRLESYFKLFFERAIKSIFSETELLFLSKNSDLKQQAQLIQKYEPRIKEFMSIFFNQKDLAEKGRSQAQFKYVDSNRPVEYYLIERTLKALDSHLISENPYLYYIFNGQFSLRILPDHLSVKNYELMKNRIDNLEILNTDLESLSEHSNIKYNFFNLSDIFEYVSEEDFDALLDQISKISAPNATLGYWSLFVDRQPKNNAYWTKLSKLSEELSKKDRVWFYKDYTVLECS